MSDVFVSYKREDLERVERLVAALAAEGLDVWWDRLIPPGAPWEAAITEALERSRCALVCWSHASTDPHLGAKVQVEARVANDAGKLIQVLLDDVEQPLFFRQQQASDLSRWSGDGADASFRRLAAAIRETAGGARPVRAPTAPARPRRVPNKVAASVAAAAAALLVGGALTAGNADARLAICSVMNPDALCVTAAELDGYEARLRDAKTRLAQRAIFYINDRRQNFPTIAWAISQLAAPNAAGLADYRDAYNRRLGDLVDPSCGCLRNGPAPHTMTNAWLLMATGAFKEAAPAAVVDALLLGQSTEGWWSAALDAIDEPSNGATYATAFVVLALQRQLDLGVHDAARAAAMRKAIAAGSLWLVHQVSTAEGDLADYPQSLRKLSNPGLDGQALAALALTRPDVDLGPRAAKVARALARLPPLWETASSDVLVQRRDGNQYYDDFRHISAAWMVLGAASAIADLKPTERARTLSSIRRVFARDLASPQLFEREWVAAEAIFALDEAVRRLRALQEQGLP